MNIWELETRHFALVFILLLLLFCLHSSTGSSLKWCALADGQR